jgi:hypothetical protein
MIDPLPNNIEVLRDENGKDGCFSHVTHLETGSKWQGAELECKNNEPDISSIPPTVKQDPPEMTYRVEMRPHPHHGSLGDAIGFPGQCYEILDVSNRTAVLIHIANYAGQASQHERTDLLGCMALGTDRGKMLPPGYNAPQEAVEHSGTAIAAFYKEMAGKPFNITFKNRF